MTTVFFFDALSSIRHIKSTILAKAVQQIAAARRAVLQYSGWIPAHRGKSGNEQAGILAEEGAREQHGNSVSFRSHKSALDAKDTEGIR